MRAHRVPLLFLLTASVLACDSQETGARDGEASVGGKADDAACDPTLVCGQALTCVDGLLFPTTCGPDNCDAPIADRFETCEAEGGEETGETEGGVLDDCREAAIDAHVAASLSLSDGRPIYGRTTISSTNRIGEPPQDRPDLRLQLFVDGVTNADPAQRVEACRDLTDAELAEVLAPTIGQVFDDPRCFDDPECELLEPLPVALVPKFAPMHFTGERAGCVRNDMQFSVDMFDIDPFWNAPTACGSAFCLSDIPVVQDTSTIPNQLAFSALALIVADDVFAEMHDPSTSRVCEPAGETRQYHQVRYVGPRDSNICEDFREDYDPQSC